MTVEEEETMMPMKDVSANPIGIVKSCDQNADLGVLAKREKSGSLLQHQSIQYKTRKHIRRKNTQTYTMRVAKFAIEDRIPFTIAQPNSLPCNVFF